MSRKTRRVCEVVHDDEDVEEPLVAALFLRVHDLLLGLDDPLEVVGL